MVTFTKSDCAALQRHKGKYGLAFRFITALSILLVCLLAVSNKAVAQNLPAPERCTSNDLEVISVTLVGGDPCNSCTPGTIVTRTLRLGIINKTGSTRTTFAYWGTLEEYNPVTGAVVKSTPIQDCFGPPNTPGAFIGPNETKEQNSVQISYTCGSSLRIVNVYQAWTDASDGDKNQCPLDPSKIAPKCGISPIINIPVGISFTFTKVNVLCFGASTGSITATASGGTPPYQYKLGSGGTYGSSGTFSNLAAGTYRVFARDVNNCETYQDITITQPSAAVTINSATPTPIPCFGGTSQITGTVSGGTAPYTVILKLNGAQVGTSQTVSTSGGSFSFTSLAAGSYTIEARDASGTTGGCFDSELAPISQPAAALLMGTCGKTDVTCYGASTGSVSAGTVSNAVGTVTYTWKNAAGTTVGTTATVNNLPAGTYTLTVTDNCASVTCTVTINQPAAALALGTCGKTDASCVGASTGSVSAGTVTNAVGTVTYTWKNAAGTTVGTTATVNNLPAGTYTLTVTDNCFTRTCTVTIGGPTTGLTLGTCGKTDVTCYGASTGSVSAGTVSNAVGTVTYTWKNAAGTTVGTTATVNNLPAGTYTLTVTDNCATQTCTVTIGGPTAALALGTCGKTDASCVGASDGSVSAGTVTNAVGTVTYTWKNAAGTTVGTTATVNNLPAGTYTLTVTDNCFTRTCTVTINAPVCDVEGCTPGYWKNHPQAWALCTNPSFNSETTNFFTTFGITDHRGLGAGDQNYTLMDALNQEGGGYNALARHAVAALLNACHPGVDYKYTTQQIISAVAAAFNSGVTGQKTIGTSTYSSVEGLKNLLVAANEEGCPLNNTGAVESVTTRALQSNELTLLASPNPYYSNINFNFVSPQSGIANLEIYDLMGRKLAKVFQGQVEKGVPKTIYYRVPSELRVPMIYRLTIGDKTSFGKLLPGSTD
jgi:hypothetical protein